MTTLVAPTAAPITAPTASKIVRSTRSRRGVSLIYATAAMGMFVAVGAFAMDAGRLQLARGELRRAADAAARAGASGLSTSASQAFANATMWSKQNNVDGRVLPDSGIAVTVGNWNALSHAFSTTLSGSQTYNAVRVTLSRPASGVDSVPILWANLLGCKGVAVKAESIAMFVPGENVTQQVDGVANPFLSGMPAGTLASRNNPHNSVDTAGDATSSSLALRKQSPPVVPLSVTPGQWITFDGIAGTVRHDPSLTDYSPDGQLNDVGHNTNGNENGIGDLNAPINALVGVFLGADKPSDTAAPSKNIDASTAAARDFDDLKPATKQIFFVGDGVNSSGNRQRFQVPAGATRLYLATWDYYEWNNNSGYRVVRISRPGSVVTVR